jgi:hypothetical protein
MPILNFSLTEDQMERRKNRRVPFQVEATVQIGQTSIKGMVDNLSMKGMFLASETLSGGSSLEISIRLSGSSSSLSIELKGRAVRLTEAGIAIEFQEMDWTPLPTSETSSHKTPMTLTLPTKSIAGPSCRNSRPADRRPCPGINLSAISASHVSFIFFAPLRR